LMSQDWAGLQQGNIKPAVQKEITQLGLDYGLMTQFTSFVAVEERVVTTNGQPQRVEVPVEMPAGVSYEGVFGDYKGRLPAQSAALNSIGGPVSRTRVMAGSNTFYGAGIGSGSYGASSGAGSAGGFLINGNASAPPPSVPKQAVVAESDAVSSSLPVKKLTKERETLESKLHPALLQTFDCWKKSGNDCKLAKDGTMEVQLWLNDDSSAVLDQLKALGFTISQVRPKEKTVVGRLPVEKLAALVRITALRFASPVRA